MLNDRLGRGEKLYYFEIGNNYPFLPKTLSPIFEKKKERKKKKRKKENIHIFYPPASRKEHRHSTLVYRNN